MFGKDTETINWMNEIAGSINQLQKKITTIWGISQSIDNHLSTTNALLIEIKEELSNRNKIAISSKLTQRLYAKNNKGKKLLQSEQYAYLDEILEEVLEDKVEAIQDELHKFTETIKKLRN